MAAPAGIPDQSLEDRIYQLLKLSADAGMRHVLEEATLLCSTGRHMEAGALVEKAEAMISLASHQAGPKEVPPSAGRQAASETATAERPLAARLAADIANGLSNVLVRAIQDLEQHITA